MGSATDPVRVAIVGLGFGAEFIPIYQRHPRERCTPSASGRRRSSTRSATPLASRQRYTNYDDVLADPDVDFVHINSPIPDHAWMSIAALKAGKHVMCTVPMATTIEECEQIVDLVQETGLKYMMAETVVYSREFLFIKELYEKGELGKIQYMAGLAPAGHGRLARVLGAHDPHALRHARRLPGAGPGQRARRVRLLFRLGDDQRAGGAEVGQRLRRRVLPHQDQGFGHRRPHLAFPLRHRPPVPRVLRRLRHQEELRVGADRGRGTCDPHGQEAGAGDRRACQRARLRPSAARRDPALHHARFRTPSISPSSRAPGHGGSHPHLVNEFVSALVEDRDPWPNAVTSANWTCVGICAHQSAEQGGAIVQLPEFTLAV